MIEMYLEASMLSMIRSGKTTLTCNINVYDSNTYRAVHKLTVVKKVCSCVSNQYNSRTHFSLEHRLQALRDATPLTVAHDKQRRTYMTLLVKYAERVLAVTRHSLCHLQRRCTGCLPLHTWHVRQH
jgi:hypothetical protein